jgi:SWI/SNF-related matrix-associated actin-dependent regulator of chromatin subfamily A3
LSLGSHFLRFLVLDYVSSDNTLMTDSPSSNDKSSNDEPTAKRFKKDSIFTAKFRRVLLDEAHLIRNPKSRTFHACKSLRADYRWALTGTPLQNKPEDIGSLFSFLGVPALGDKQVFRRAISQPIKEGDDKGLATLRTMMAHVALRRSKKMVDINLPDKEVQVREVEFPAHSRHKEIYDTLFQSARGAMCVAMQEGSDQALSHTHVFEVLTRLRQACCSGSLVPLERLKRAEQVLAAMGTKGSELSAEEGMKLLEKLRCALEDEDGPPDCAVCFDPLSENGSVALRGCGHVFCTGCISKVAAGLHVNCPFCRQPFSSNDMVKWAAATEAAGKSEKSAESLSEKTAELGPCPKVEALLAGLAEMKADEKAVCFSQFTKFLDEIEPVLTAQGYTFARIDGKKNATQRVQALSSFAKDDGPRIMLCSLHAAGTGLNLARANHAFMMDTWFNAAVELQAMDRIHRIGQLRPVRVIRFVAAESVESRMLSLQESKAAMGKGAFETLSPEEKKKARLSDVKKLLELD